MDDDLNTAGALAVLFDLTREINRARDDGRSIAPAQAMLRARRRARPAAPGAGGVRQGAEPFIDLLVQLRNDLRAEKQFPLSDSVRDGLAALGITVEDGAEGTRWRRRD